MGILSIKGECMKLKNSRKTWLNNRQVTEIRLYRAVGRKYAREVMLSFLGMLLALIMTALLAMPHLMREPIEVAAVPEIIQESPASSEVVIDHPERTEKDELLLLVNADNALPQDMKIVTRSYDGVEINAVIYIDLCALMDAAYHDDVTLWLASGYRSVEKQREILERAVSNRMSSGMTEEEALEDALMTIQSPGHSEHHTGMAIDFNDVKFDFENTETYTWLRANAAAYGFVERYPREKEAVTGIAYEPWRFRYVGREHARKMYELNMCLEEYVEYLYGE